jgi:hypothetical protein
VVSPAIKHKTPSGAAPASSTVMGRLGSTCSLPSRGEVEPKAKRDQARVYPTTQERMELDTAVFGSAGKRRRARRSRNREPGGDGAKWKSYNEGPNKKAKAQIGEAQE